MNHYYADILDRLGEPKWWDERAVPRYCEFSPDECADIHAREAVLMRVACQSCHRLFDVALTSHPRSEVYPYDEKLRSKIEDGSIHYGDPPNVRCCDAGPTMNVWDVRVLQYWELEFRGAFGHEWARDRRLEVQLPDAREIPE